MIRVFFLFGIFLCIPAVVFAADFTNDSVIVDIIDEGASADVIPEADSDVTPSLGGGGEVIDFSNDTETGTDTITEVVVTIENTPGATTNNSSEATEGGANTTGPSTGTSEQTISAESILTTLTGNQAFTSGGNGAAGASGGTQVSGEKTREALLSRGIVSLTLPSLDFSESAATRRLPYSRADMALIVSGGLVKISDIDQVFYTTNTLSVEYRSRGRILFALPITYTTKIDLRFDESTIKKRVRIRFPWYKFFMWTGVSKKELQNRVDEIIVSAPLGQEYDKAAFVFNGIVDLLGASILRTQ